MFYFKITSICVPSLESFTLLFRILLACAIWFLPFSKNLLPVITYKTNIAFYCTKLLHQTHCPVRLLSKLYFKSELSALLWKASLKTSCFIENFYLPFLYRLKCETFRFNNRKMSSIEILYIKMPSKIIQYRHSHYSKHSGVGVETFLCLNFKEQ